jgi:hypothetical protein
METTKKAALSRPYSLFQRRAELRGEGEKTKNTTTKLGKSKTEKLKSTKLKMPTFDIFEPIEVFEPINLESYDKNLEEQKAMLKLKEEEDRETQANLATAYASLAGVLIAPEVSVLAEERKLEYTFTPWKYPYSTSVISELKARLKESFVWKPTIAQISTINVKRFMTKVRNSFGKSPLYVSILHSDGSYTDTGAISFPSQSSVSFYRNTYADPDNRSRTLMTPIQNYDIGFYDPTILLIRNVASGRAELQLGPVLQFIYESLSQIINVETYFPSENDKEAHITIALSLEEMNVTEKSMEENVFMQADLQPMIDAIRNSTEYRLLPSNLEPFRFLTQLKNRILTVVTIGTPDTVKYEEGLPEWAYAQNKAATLTPRYMLELAAMYLSPITCDNVRYHGNSSGSLDAMIVRQNGTITKLEYNNGEENNRYIDLACHFVPPPAGSVSVVQAEASEISKDTANALNEMLKTAELKLDELAAVLQTLERKAQGAAAAVVATESKPYVRQLPRMEGSELPPKSEEESAKDLQAQDIVVSCATTPQEFAANLAVAIDTVRFESRTAANIAKEKQLADAFDLIVKLFDVSENTLATALKNFPYKNFVGPLAWEKYIRDFKEQACKKKNEDGTEIDWDEFEDVYKFEQLLGIVKNIKMYVKQLPHVEGSEIPAEKQWEKEKSFETAKKAQTAGPSCEVSPEEFAATLAVAMDTVKYPTRTALNIAKETALSNAFDQIVSLFNISDETLVTVLARFPYKTFNGPLAWRRYIDGFMACEAADTYKLPEVISIIETLKLELNKK